jgi:hypothetical protein
MSTTNPKKEIHGRKPRTIGEVMSDEVIHEGGQKPPEDPSPAPYRETDNEADRAMRENGEKGVKRETSDEDAAAFPIGK